MTAAEDQARAALARLSELQAPAPDIRERDVLRSMERALRDLLAERQTSRPQTDEERRALQEVVRVMNDHEPRWNLGQCRCGAPLGDSIDWNWHLANQATLAALRQPPAPSGMTREALAVTDEMVDLAARTMYDRRNYEDTWDELPAQWRAGWLRDARTMLEAVSAALPTAGQAPHLPTREALDEADEVLRGFERAREGYLSPEARDTEPRRRLLVCVERWPECESGAYNPACCRFPKSCSCTSYRDDTPDDLLEPRTARDTDSTDGGE